MKYILGLDISLTSTGYVVCRFDKGRIEVLEKGRVRTNSKQPYGVRLQKIRDRVDILFDMFPIDFVVKESGFTKGFSTQPIFRAVGVAEMTCADKGYIEEMKSVTPTEVKKWVAGYGKATKDEVANGVMDYVGQMTFESDDVSDAVAVVIAYLRREGIME